jgi:AAA15 family ATPase/GTPase
MRLDKIEYFQDEGLPNSWRIEECEIGNVNLIVGKNATGKSRILANINLLADLLTGKDLKENDSKRYWKLIYDTKIVEEQKIYILEFGQGVVIQEKFTIGNKVYLQRDSNSEGSIWAEQLNLSMKFQIPRNQIAALNRRDLIQHKFLEPLYEWADSLRYYQFGTDFGKRSYLIF